jgi:hypothetical protein
VVDGCECRKVGYGRRGRDSFIGREWRVVASEVCGEVNEEPTQSFTPSYDPRVTVSLDFTRSYKQKPKERQQENVN